MGRAARVQEYVEQFPYPSFSDFSDTVSSLYPGSDAGSLGPALEFSLSIGDDGPSLRYGLFGLTDAGALRAVLGKYTSAGIDDALEIMEGSPEYGFGIDWNGGSPRAKLYFLRLPDCRSIRDGMGARLERLSAATGIPGLSSTPGVERCYIIGLDFTPDGLKDIKVYTRHVPARSDDAKALLGAHGVTGMALDAFAECREFKDTTYSYKRSRSGLSGLAVFHEIGDDACVGRIVAAAGVAEAVSVVIAPLLPVVHSHIGITAGIGDGRSALTLYYSGGGA